MDLPNTLRCRICSHELHISECKISCPACGFEPPHGEDESIFITAKEAKERLNLGAQLIDVRTEEEHDITHIQGSVLIPLNELPSRLHELDTEKEMMVHCHHGIRSYHAAVYLKQHGFKNVKSVKGGIDAWSLEIDSFVPRY